MKERYQGNEKAKKSSVKQCLLELEEFRQEEGETIELYYDRLSELIFKCNCYGVPCSTLEYNPTFLMGLREEWRNISLMIKTQQSFNGYSLGGLHNVLKALESEINEIAEERKMNLGGPLALMSTVSAKDSEIEVAKLVDSKDEEFLMNSEDEVVAYYSNNKVKKFFKKPFNQKYKTNNEFKGNTLSGKGTGVEVKEENKESKIVVEKAEKTLKGNFGFDCNYCNVANHLAVDCTLRKREENK